MLTMHEIFFGYESNPEFPGLFPFLKKALTKECPCECDNFMKVYIC